MALAIHDALLHAGVLHPKPSAAAWLGRSDLYRTRLEAVQNGEQRVESVSSNELFELARSHVRKSHRDAQPKKEKCS
ncbi:hypothetical protein HU735_11750 [Pseudomonas sp. BW16M2]|nr:hypothetical protein [Pseudomonas sp. BW16M2]